MDSSERGTPINGHENHRSSPPHHERERCSFEQIEYMILQLNWLGQRQCLQLLESHQFRLTLPQFYTLLHLYDMDGECKMSDLADATHQSAASLTGVVDRLLNKELVVRTRHSQDRRQVMVALTEKGGSLVAHVRQQRRTQLQQALSLLQEEDIEMLLRLLDEALAGMLQLFEHPPIEHPPNGKERTRS